MGCSGTMQHVRTIASDRFGNDYFYRCNNEIFTCDDGTQLPCGAQVVLIFKEAAVKQ